jgi:DNA ligase (NAD+)
LIDGSTVSRATLHNEDQIARLDIRVGDTVVLQKAGDVIPEVLMVLKELRPQKSVPYRFPKTVEGCGGDGRIERVPGEAAYRCVVRDSDFLHRQRLYHFVSKQAMNIDGVGPRIIDALLDAELITTASDLYTLTKDEFLTLEGFQERSAQNAVDAIFESRTVPLERLLVALSIDTVGEETARVLAEYFGSIEKVAKATEEELSALYGVGEIVASAVNTWFHEERHQAELARLLPHLTIVPPRVKQSTALAGETIVFTGTLETMARDEAEALARLHGASTSGSVSKKTTVVVAGENAGSKVERARELGVTVISEQEFLDRIR